MRNRIAELRRGRGWSQTDLAAAIRIRFPEARPSLTAVSRWETGAVTPSLVDGIRLAVVLGVPVERLFTLD